MPPIILNLQWSSLLLHRVNHEVKDKIGDKHIVDEVEV
jgi:hypothetical protein